MHEGNGKISTIDFETREMIGWNDSKIEDLSAEGSYHTICQVFLPIFPMKHVVPVVVMQFVS